jgi:hypothetical protein
MPTHFGPTPGPRQLPDGRKSDRENNPKRLAITVSYLTDRAAIEAILPPGFIIPLEFEPIVTAEIQYLKEFDWLAGRGYNTLGVKLPIIYRGKDGDVPGVILAVLWENLADPILSGRDELGFNKLWCEIPEPVVHNGRHSFGGSWLGHKFFEMELWDLMPGPGNTAGAVMATPPGSKGMLHFKYVPTTGRPGETDAAYVTMTPAANPEFHFIERFDAKGMFKFRETRWEDMPTQFHVVNGFAALPLKEFRGASMIRSKGGKDFGDQVIVR